MAEDMNQSESNTGFGNDPDYGLPEVSLTPIERGGLGRRKGTVRSGNRNVRNAENRSNTPLIVSLLFAFLVVLAALWYFFGQDIFSSDADNKQTATVEDTTPGDQDTSPADTGFDTGAGEDDPGGDNADDGSSDAGSSADSFGGDQQGIDLAGATLPEAGVFSTIESRTGRTYVIIGSFFDDDLARDYATELGRQGISTTLIMPAGNNKFYRLSIADFDTITEAINNLDDLRAQHGSNLWIIKY